MTPPDTHSVFARRRERVARVRRQVTALAVAVFLVLWGLIFFQLVTGHDPALAAKKTSATTTTSSPITTSSSGSTSSATSSSSTSASSSSATPVTTSQS